MWKDLVKVVDKATEKGPGRSEEGRKEGDGHVLNRQHTLLLIINNNY